MNEDLPQRKADFTFKHSDYEFHVWVDEGFIISSQGDSFKFRIAGDGVIEIGAQRDWHCAPKFSEKMIKAYNNFTFNREITKILE